MFWKPLRSIIPVTTPDFEVTGFKITGPVDKAGCERAVAEVKRSLMPASREEITKAYIELQAKCTLSKERASESDKAKALRHAAMMDDLQQYPADLVLHALRNWSKTCQWVPVSSEITQKIQRETDMRKSLLECLEQAPYRGEKRQTEDKGRRYSDYTDEEKAAHDARSAKVLEILRAAGEGVKL